MCVIKNVGKHLFGIGNISASCSNVFLPNKVYEVYESFEKIYYYTNSRYTMPADVFHEPLMCSIGR